jgi:ABC-type polysaccharide/polyol phosphate export permease
MKKVKELAVPFIISLGIILAGEISAIMASRSSGMPGQPAILSLIIILLFPVTPVIYGWITRDHVGAMIIGILPMFLLGLIIPARSGDFPESRWIITGIVYWGMLMLLAGLAGYFAAKKELKYLIVSVFLIGVWFAVFVSGLN